MTKTYPTGMDIVTHKDKVWQMLLLMFKVENFSEKDVERALRCLAGDAMLWVYNNCKECHNDDYLERAKAVIPRLRVKLE